LSPTTTTGPRYKSKKVIMIFFCQVIQSLELTKLNNLCREFVELNSRDQENLFSRNSSLFIQLILAGYFNSRNQLKYMDTFFHLPNQIPQRTPGGNILRLDLQSFEQMSRSFKNNIDLNYLSELMKVAACFDTDDVDQGPMLYNF